MASCGKSPEVEATPISSDHDNTEISIPSTDTLELLTPAVTETHTLVPSISPTSPSALSPGLYLVTMNGEKDKLIIRDMEGNEKGIFLNYALHGIIKPEHNLFAYNSAVVTSSDNLELFGPTFALFKMKTQEVLPISWDPAMSVAAFGFGGSWSPDGQYVIINLVSDRIYPKLALVSVSSQSGQEIPLWDGEAAYSDWSPNGEMVVFSSSHFSDQEIDSSIFLLDTDCFSDLNSCPENVLPIFSNEMMSYYYPSWAPDNIHIVFGCSGYSSIENSLCIGDIQSGEIQVLLNVAYGSPDWSPDGE